MATRSPLQLRCCPCTVPHACSLKQAPGPCPTRQVRGRWVPPWHVLAGAILLVVSLLHFLAGPASAPGLDYLEYVSLGSVALCLPRIALRAALALRRGVSGAGRKPACAVGRLAHGHARRLRTVCPWHDACPVNGRN